MDRARASGQASFFKNDKFAERANIELLSVSPGQARAKMTLHPHHLNGYGTVQGGSHLYAGGFRLCRCVEFARHRRRGHQREHHLHEGRPRPARCGPKARKCPGTSSSAPTPWK